VSLGSWPLYTPADQNQCLFKHVEARSAAACALMIVRAKRMLVFEGLKMLDAKYEYVSGEIHNGTDHHHDGANDLLMPQLVVSWY